jgi:hypothetical protein
MSLKRGALKGILLCKLCLNLKRFAVPNVILGTHQVIS